MAQTKWEYKTEVIKMDAATATLQEKLNALGKEGWELVMGQRIFRSSQSTVACTFKRVIEEDKEGGKKK